MTRYGALRKQDVDEQVRGWVLKSGTQLQAERAARLTATNRALRQVGHTGLPASAPAVQAQGVAPESPLGLEVPPTVTP